MANMKSLSRIKYMYRGLLPPTFNRCLGRMFTFGGYDSCRRVLSKNSHFKGQKLNFLAALGSGAFEGKIDPKLGFPRAQEKFSKFLWLGYSRSQFFLDHQKTLTF